MAKKQDKSSTNEPIAPVNFLEDAKEVGVDQDYFFKTTLQRYKFLVQILQKLKKSINEEGVIVKKEYVKNRKNIYTHPAIAEYDKTSSAANNTAATLLNIIEKAIKEKGGTEEVKDDLFERLKLQK